VCQRAGQRLVDGVAAGDIAVVFAMLSRSSRYRLVVFARGQHQVTGVPTLSTMSGISSGDPEPRSTSFCDSEVVSQVVK